MENTKLICGKAETRKLKTAKTFVSILTLIHVLVTKLFVSAVFQGWLKIFHSNQWQELTVSVEIVCVAMQEISKSSILWIR